MTTLHSINSIDRTLLRRAFLAGALGLAWMALACPAQALLPPPSPDGGYPGNNTAEGDFALFSLTSGVLNTAIGCLALNNNTSGGYNTANGSNALFQNTSGDNNTATGSAALATNTSGGSNTATGANALISNRGSVNTATGADALYHNVTGWFNAAMGSQALFSNTTGLSNTANGYQALYLNTTGGSNTATGVQALFRTTGGGNIALGFQAGVNLTTGNNNIDIGNAGVAAESGKIRIGTQGTHNSTFIAGISGVAVTGPHVVVSANGKLGVAASSARFKKAIKPMDHASQAIHRLEPVTFRYNEELDPNGIPQFGLVAEEVEKVNADLVVRDEEAKAMTVRYDAVNAMLLNEFIKEHRKVEEQGAMIAKQQKQIEALTVAVRKVSERVELSAPAPRIVANED